MPSFIPIFTILLVLMVNHSTDSGAVSNPHKKIEFRKSRSFVKSKTKKHGKSAMKSRKQMELKHCDYIDLSEVGHRQCSDFDCKPSGKFLIKVFLKLFCSIQHNFINILYHRLHAGFDVSF